ncbi:LytR family transcriptional regulator [Bacillus wiedmannii]|nr:LCP family protein [Bacillus wiedmannii]PEI67987.1 LytR family transcriptional regulator [Bacillus wiedmannii]PFZ59575.1 LytR family transcriptional regulator [Bacillus wiedmannii]PHB64259.1 LytR family transcriptional regulator [Bacillus wiedmannii]PHE04591.1 LytR family transcriptional regulator [Bacillus wiedmannii]PHG63700.1 LytR family transcriptional regulator [Bacillus wiedmannii]
MRSKKALTHNSNKKRTIIITIISILLISGISYCTFLIHKVSTAVHNSHQNLNRGDKSVLRNDSVKPIDHNVSILIMGIDETDQRDNSYKGAYHTDALLLATFNKDNKTVKLVSIPRDTYTYIPIENKKDKITHAYAYGNVKNNKNGGPQATIDSVEKLFNLPVDYFVKFNFKSFIKIINDLGGIKIDVPIEFTEQDSNGEPDSIHLKKGIQTLNGEEALALARTRHIDSDAMRGTRQQLVIEAIMKKVTNINSISKIGDIFNDIESDFKTNLSFNDILSFYKYSMNSSIEKIQLVGEDLYLNNGPNGKRVYYYNPDKQKLKELTNQLQNHLEISIINKD